MQKIFLIKNSPKNLTGKNSKETIDIFCNTDNNYFADLAKNINWKKDRLLQLLDLRTSFLLNY